jgi:AraC-like DNA-binding protein
MHLIILFCITLALSISPSYGALVDSLFLPKHNSVIRDNIVKIAVPQIIQGDTLEMVRFVVFYSALASNKIKRSIRDIIVDEDSIPPFEAIWDCSRIPDQDNSNLRFICKAKTTQSTQDEPGYRFFMAWAVLDRSGGLSELQWKSHKADSPIKIDANLGEWFSEDSVVFENNDNRITAASKWDRDFLYFAVRVRDSQVLLLSKKGMEQKKSDSDMQDGIELFFDLKHNHSSIRDGDDYQVLIPVNKNYELTVMDFKKQILVEKTGNSFHKKFLDFKAFAREPDWEPEIQLRETDSGYEIEAAFAWKDLGLNPEKGLTIGFNLINSDREDEFGVVMTKSWAGISDLLHHNPSEWGDLCLVDRDRKGVKAAAVAVILIAFLTIIFVVFRKRIDVMDEGEVTKQRHLVNSVMEYLKQNFHDEGLDLKKAASHANLSADYLRKIFKKETTENFTVYLNKLRIERAKELLLSTNLRISQIAFDVGYGSQEHFTKVFKNSTGTTPTDYKKKKSV